MKCIDCTNGVAFGCKYCVQCLDKAKKRAAEHYKQIKLNRICKSCSKKVNDVKGVYCHDCRNIKKATRNKRKKNGICITCGKSQACKGQKCELCYNAYISNHKSRKEIRLSNNQCAFCDELRISTSLCLKHFLQFASKTHFHTTKRWQELLELFNKQNGICPYSGRKLTLGLNASLDHIIPKCRGGKHDDIENIQWVYYQINYMKGGMMPNEFKFLVLEIANFIKPNS